uniref:Uncharacterized protein n=1 Tax=Archangium gephyra TaxID=48 RepID=A0A3S7UYD1_9BACT|nr:hypothetical protein [Archangium gephyra]
MDAADRPRPSRLRPWLGALGYLASQAVISLLGISWGPMKGGLEFQLLLLGVAFAALVAAGSLPRYFESRTLQYVLLSPGWLLVLGAVVMAWAEPYSLVWDSQWLGPRTWRTTLHPYFTLGVSVLLFLVALGHTVPFGPSRRRWLCMDVPLLVFVGICWVLHLQGYPSFEG